MHKTGPQWLPELNIEECDRSVHVLEEFSQSPGVHSNVPGESTSGSGAEDLELCIRRFKNCP